MNLLLLSLITFTTTTFATTFEPHQYLPRDLPPACPAACIDCQDQLWTWISLSSTGSQGTYTCNHPWTGCTMTGAPGGSLCDTPIGLISQNYDTHDNINPTYKSGRGGVHITQYGQGQKSFQTPSKKYVADIFIYDSQGLSIGNVTKITATDDSPTVLVGSALPYVMNVTFGPGGDLSPIAIMYPAEYNNASLVGQSIWTTDDYDSVDGSANCGPTGSSPHGGYENQVRNFNCGFQIPVPVPQQLYEIGQ